MKIILVLLLIFCLSRAIGCGPDANPSNGNNNSNANPEVTKSPETTPDYEDTPEAIVKNIQEADSTITYAHLKKNADKYAGKPWMCTGRILEIFEKDGETTARIGIGAYGSDPIWVHGKFTNDFIEKDRVTVIGYLSGDYRYVSQAGWNITIPALAARAMLSPKDVAKLKAQVRRTQQPDAAQPAQKSKHSPQESDLQRRRNEANRLLNQ